MKVSSPPLNPAGFSLRADALQLRHGRARDRFFTACSWDPEALQEQGLRPSNPRRAYVDSVALRLGKRATLVPDPKGRVYGVLMTLMHSEIDRLYSEASVESLSTASAVLAQLRTAPAEVALCYNLPTAPDGGITNAEYATALQFVARKMGLPEHYAVGLSG